MTTKLKMKHPDCIVSLEKIINAVVEKSRRKKYEKYGQLPFHNSNIFHNNVLRFQIREK